MFQELYIIYRVYKEDSKIISGIPFRITISSRRAY